MSDKAKKIIKFAVTIGIVLSAVGAVFAIVIKMQKKLAAVGEEENTDSGCSGSCSECGMCDSDGDIEAETEDDTEDDSEKDENDN